MLSMRNVKAHYEGAKYKIFGSPPKRKTYGSSKRGWYKWYNHHYFLTQFELDLDFYQTPGGNGINQGGQGELCSPPPSLFSHHWLLRQPITRHWHFSLQKEAGAKAITKFFSIAKKSFPMLETNHDPFHLLLSHVVSARSSTWLANPWRHCCCLLQKHKG